LGINFILLFLGVSTIIIASLTAFFEIDIKKIVALSTLRQLGVIITALGSGFYILSFFHLLSHAFFKALLFVRAGNLIHRSESYQDLRVIGGSSEIIILRKRIVLGCSARLCGLPFISAFYSKEIIIERLLTYNLSFFSYFFIMAGIIITIFYRIRFFILSLI
jgi:NADH-ubiquinone oxidoreductase chain 5